MQNEGVQNFKTCLVIVTSRVQNLIAWHPNLFPNSDENTVSDRLGSNGVRIRRERVQESMRRVDPLSLASRCRNVLHRRVYDVCSLNALWPIDGYHKLIWWKFQQPAHPSCTAWWSGSAILEIAIQFNVQIEKTMSGHSFNEMTCH